MTHARGGRFDALLAEMKNAGHDPLSASFLSGLALYAHGELNAAAERFREALKVDSEFFPAAFYLGACYAAGGRHREAANAWMTSLVTESDAPFIYPLIADAFLRARDIGGAVDILKEAAGQWPENEQLQVRLALAYVMAGRAADAVKTLDPYLARHPGDHEQLFVMLRAIYEARNAGVSIESPEKDRERFVRYAQAYVAAGGPHVALVERWKKFLEGK
jgi:thioredoxin-like negative regulator of GroEL